MVTASAAVVALVAALGVLLLSPGHAREHRGVHAPGTGPTHEAPTGREPATSTEPPSALLRNSMFDQRVASWPLDPLSPQLSQDIVKQYKSAYGSVTVNTDRPVYWASPHQARVDIHVAKGCHDFLTQTGRMIPIPQGATPGTTSDGILTVYQPSRHSAWEFWKASDAGGTWSACWGGKLNMRTTDGVFPFPYGETASGISNLATEITDQDIASGAIDHTVGMVVLGDSCDWSGTSVHGGLFPADRTDCGYKTPGWPAEGQWFRFPPRMPVPGGLTPFARMVFKAIQTYGAVVVDQAAAVAVLADQPSAWSVAGHRGIDPITASFDGVPAYKVIASLPWGQLQAVQPPSYVQNWLTSSHHRAP